MFPEFVLFGKTIGLYQITALLGIFATGILACKHARKKGYDDNDMIVVLLIAGIGVILGGHLLYGLTNLELLRTLFADPGNITGIQDFFTRLVSIFGGSVFYGGLLGGIVAASLCIKRKKLDFGEYADMIAPGVPLFHVFGRIGCFLGGCCYGIECSFGLTYQNSLVPSANGVPRFPVQLLEAAFNLALFILLEKWYRDGKWKHKLFLAYLVIYPVGRFLLEFLRGDVVRGFVGPFSTSQWISIFLLITSGVLLWKKRGKLSAQELEVAAEKGQGKI